jgi:hypothetical protein
MDDINMDFEKWIMQKDFTGFRWTPIVGFNEPGK